MGSEGFLSVDGSVSAEIGDCVLATVATNYTYPWQVVFDQTYVIELVTIYNTNDAEGKRFALNRDSTYLLLPACSPVEDST